MEIICLGKSLCSFKLYISFYQTCLGIKILNLPKMRFSFFFFLLGLSSLGLVSSQCRAREVVWPSDNYVTRADCRRCVGAGRIFLLRPSTSSLLYQCHNLIPVNSPIAAFPFYGSFACSFIGCDDPHAWAKYTLGQFICQPGARSIFFQFLILCLMCHVLWSNRCLSLFTSLSIRCSRDSIWELPDIPLLCENCPPSHSIVVSTVMIHLMFAGLAVCPIVHSP